MVIGASNVEVTYRQIISEQLHYERTIFIGIFVKCVQFGDRVIECLSGQSDKWLTENQNVEQVINTDQPIHNKVLVTASIWQPLAS